MHRPADPWQCASEDARTREELLVHLTSIFDEELVVRDGDVTAAIAAAIARFGDPSSPALWTDKPRCRHSSADARNYFPGIHDSAADRANRSRLFCGAWDLFFGANVLVWILFGVFIVLVSSIALIAIPG